MIDYFPNKIPQLFSLAIPITNKLSFKQIGAPTVQVILVGVCSNSELFRTLLIFPEEIFFSFLSKLLFFFLG